jgi:hypothetical protein
MKPMLWRVIGWAMAQIGGVVVVRSLWQLVQDDRILRVSGHEHTAPITMFLGFALIAIPLGQVMRFEPNHRWWAWRIASPITVFTLLVWPWFLLQAFGAVLTTRVFALIGLGLFCAFIGVTALANRPRAASR